MPDLCVLNLGCFTSSSKRYEWPILHVRNWTAIVQSSAMTRLQTTKAAIGMPGSLTIDSVAPLPKRVKHP